MKEYYHDLKEIRQQKGDIIMESLHKKICYTMNKLGFDNIIQHDDIKSIMSIYPLTKAECRTIIDCDNLNKITISCFYCEIINNEIFTFTGYEIIEVASDYLILSKVENIIQSMWKSIDEEFKQLEE